MRSVILALWSLAAILFVLLWVGIGLRECAAEASECAPLGDRAIRFVLTRPGGARRAARDRAWIQRLASIVEAESRESRISAELVIAISFRESSWQPRARGRRGERGLMQIHGKCLKGVDNDPFDPVENIRAGIRCLETCLETCGTLPRALYMYATGECGRPEYRERMVLRWAEHISDCGE